MFERFGLRVPWMNRNGEIQQQAYVGRICATLILNLLGEQSGCFELMLKKEGSRNKTRNSRKVLISNNKFQTKEAK
jgi:hypothetical protein